MKRATRRILGLVIGCCIVWAVTHTPFTNIATAQKPAEYAADIRPLLKKYCLDCHSTEAVKGSLDLERFASLEHIRKDLKPWQQLIEQMEAGEMPPKGKPQPSAEEKKAILAWTRGMLDTEAKARAGDPGHVPLRRLSNAEYDATIRDLTGVDLKPTKEFPADGAAGEGFTNAAEALADISPALLTKYLNASKEIADRAVLLPEGFRFSQGKTRRDWTDESLAKLRQFYSGFATPDGKIHFQLYVAATIKHRKALIEGKIKPDEVANQEKLNAKYFAILWQTLNDKTVSHPLDAIRSKWKTAEAKDVPALIAEVAAWQKKLWKAEKVGSYMRAEGTVYFENLSRQLAVNPPDKEIEDKKELLLGYGEFRKVFPLFVCFPQIVPADEAVSLKMFHREDEPLLRLFLDKEQSQKLEKLWVEHRFISRQAALENHHLPQFIEYVTQDQPKEMLAYFNGQRPVFKKRADDFLKEEEAAIPIQLDALLEFTGRAYRRPLKEKEKSELLALHKAIRAKGTTHEEAFRGVLSRILVSPAFLFRIEQAPKGKAPAAVDDWELATRLSYFLWSSCPDDELRKLAAAGKLRDPKVLAAQVQRMIMDDRLRTFAIEFGTQWIHVRGFDELKEKNEKLFPSFDANLRKAIYEESILFFQDLFQHDRPITSILDSDATYLNESLAKHYGIPGVAGPQWRRVEGVKKYGRGGILGLASVQTKESGASRTSPVLRGNWVVETLLGEKLPRPPKDVPKLPEEEGDGGLSTRQQVEKHVSVASCAACHVRIDPLGFALEAYDPIGRLRAKDLGNLPVDTKAKLKDGTEFDGLDGLRTYLLTKKKEVIVRLFCRRLLGYALGRAVTLSDTSLLDEMVRELEKNDGKVLAAVQAIVRSPQFLKVRGKDFED